MESMNSQEEFAHYQSLWDNAMRTMPPVEKRAPTLPPSLTFDDDDSETDLNVGLDDVNAVSMIQERRSSASRDLDFHDMLLLSEDIDKVFNPQRYSQNRAKVANASGSASNPVSLTTVGRDQDVTVTPNFSNGKAIQELSDLKSKLESLERDIHSAVVKDNKKNEDTLEKRLSSIRSKIEELSNELSPSVYQNNN